MEGKGKHECVEKVLVTFSSRFAARAHTLSAKGGQNAHLRAEMCFPDVHAAGKNEFDFFRACERELCEAFFDSLTMSIILKIPIKLISAVLYRIYCILPQKPL